MKEENEVWNYKLHLILRPAAPEAKYQTGFLPKFLPWGAPKFNIFKRNE